ncbi:hypothetical protein [uncultured Brevundimonas sp.]|jgi:cell division protein FtsW (lipid II flippase)|uniref:hypothetical protein n=1 Tax=uncultured Brevundimonas sp. TaxID=213418 RepID=UPI002591CCC3|nr:hypothetical protein [uncultured Brevundimonas sp.]
MKMLAVIAKWFLAALAASWTAGFSYALVLYGLAELGKFPGQSEGGASGWIALGGFALAAPVHFLGVALLGPVAMLLLRRTRLDNTAAVAVIGGGLAIATALPLLGARYGSEYLAFAIPAPISGAIAAVIFRYIMRSYGSAI